METNQSLPALLRAIKFFGSQTALAQVVHKKQPHVFKWLRSKHGLKPIYCSIIEKASNGVITRCDLRPNDYGLIWPELLPSSKRRSVRVKQKRSHE